MQDAFQEKEFQKPSWWQELLGLTPNQNAVIALNNLLAHKGVENVNMEDLEAIEDKYGINLHKKYQGQLKAFYRQLLETALRDKAFSDRELNQLKHVKQLLRISDKDVDVIHNEVAGRLYGARLKELLEDNKLTDNERDFLNRLQQQLRLSDKVVEDIYREQAGAIYQRLMEEAVSDERLSPEEEKELQSISENLGLDVQMDEATKEKLDKYRLYWQIENGELPEEDVRINLFKNETCYFHTVIDWYEHRQVTKRLNYSGPTLRVKIAQGLYWRAGSLGGHTASEDVTKYLDSGDLYLTNKRILFIGNRGNKRIYLKRILDFDAYSNGVQIQKDAGKSPFFAFDKHVDVFAMILGRILFNQA